jgi:hypothetical protein
MGGLLGAAALRQEQLTSQETAGDAATGS